MQDAPIFGEIPDGFESWYGRESGTFLKDGHWYVDYDSKVEIKKIAEKTIEKKHRKGDYITVNILKSADFQDKIINAKEIIKDTMGKKGSYAISNQNVFELMRDKKTTIKYKHQGKEYKLEVKA